LTRSVRFQVTLLTQDPYLMKRTVFNNIVYGLKVRRRSWALDPTGTRFALAMVGPGPRYLCPTPVG
jgi:tungstate transport system ATP-binding protein